VEEADDRLDRVVGRHDPEVEEQQVGDRLEQRHEHERLGLALELAARVVGEVGHEQQGTWGSGRYSGRVSDTTTAPVEAPVETPVEERVPLDTDGGDHDRFAHYARKEDVTRAYITGEAITALCGKKWVPTRDPTRYPICPTCVERKNAGWTL